VIFLAILTLILGGCSVELARHKTADGINKAVSKTVEVSEYDKGSVFMWEVKAREGDGKLYLLGSIHVGKDDMYPLNPIITDAFESSDILAVECDSTSVFQRPDYLQLMEKLMYTDGTDIRDHIPEDLYEKTDAFLREKGLSIGFFSLYKPVVLAQNITSLMLEEWGYSSDKGIDVYFINLARERGMEIIEIESVEFQFDMLGGFSDEIQIMELRHTLEGIETSRIILEGMLEFWNTGDVRSFEELISQEDDSLSPGEKELYREYEKIMFDDRNLNMADKAEEYLKTGKTTFYIVGAGHMVGETGIIKLLRDRGYTVVQQ
jgi:uncharacterized protein YbaP (TraB family)